MCIWFDIIVNLVIFTLSSSATLYYSQYINSVYLLWAQLLLQIFCTDRLETLHMFFFFFFFFNGIKVCI